MVERGKKATTPAMPRQPKNSQTKDGDARKWLRVVPSKAIVLTHLTWCQKFIRLAATRKKSSAALNGQQRAHFTMLYITTQQSVNKRAGEEDRTRSSLIFYHSPPYTHIMCLVVRIQIIKSMLNHCSARATVDGGAERWMTLWVV